MHRSRRFLGLALLTATLAGCRIDVPAANDVPEGYHQMPNGMLMADVQMETTYRDLGANGIQVATHTRPDGTVVLGSAPAVGEHGGGHDHALPDPADFPQGVVPIAIQLPRFERTAPVVATAMTAAVIEGPPVAADLAWLEQTRRPGEIGPAVFGGVTELDDEPGALADIDQLVAGDEFIVVGSDGEQLPYAVESVGPRPVSDRELVFAMGEGRSEVRLIAWWSGDVDDANATDYVVSAYALTSDA